MGLHREVIFAMRVPVYWGRACRHARVATWLFSTAALHLLSQKRGHVPQEDEEFPPYFDTFAVRLLGYYLAGCSVVE